MKEFFDIDNYDIEIIPTNGNSDNKTGLTIKGSQVDNVLQQFFFQKKGDKFSINNMDISVIDLPKNKNVVIEVEPMTRMSGNVKF